MLCDEKTYRLRLPNEPELNRSGQPKRQGLERNRYITSCARIQKYFLRGPASDLQTRVGPTKFYYSNTNTLENRGGSGPPSSCSLDLRVSLVIIICRHSTTVALVAQADMFFGKDIKQGYS